MSSHQEPAHAPPADGAGNAQEGDAAPSAEKAPPNIPAPDFTTDLAGFLRRALADKGHSVQQVRVYRRLFGFCVDITRRHEIANYPEGPPSHWAGGLDADVSDDDLLHLAKLLVGDWILQGVASAMSSGRIDANQRGRPTSEVVNDGSEDLP